VRPALYCYPISLPMINIDHNKGQKAQLFLRLALSAGFVFPVLDRLGAMGPAGSPHAVWGDWQHFVDYTQSLMPFVNHYLASAAALIATSLELLFAFCLFLGFQTRYAAYASSLLTLVFAVFMAGSNGLMAPFKYPVFVFTGAAWLLAAVGSYSWSIDKLLGEAARS